VGAEISYSHFAGQQEGDRRGEKTQDDERSADGFNYARDAEHGRQRRRGAPEAAERAEYFLPAVEGERESYDDPRERSQAGFKARERRHFESHRDSPYHAAAA
jgi:hypothetical protein